MRKLLFGLLCLVWFSGLAWAEEIIVGFKSDITVNTDSSLDVIEAITVVSEGNQIRHGIYRDFPTRYTDTHGNAVNVEFSVRDVTRDEADEPFAVENLSNGKRVRIGSKDIFVSSGVHDYVIKYHTNRQLGFFDSYDELYWNVTGNGWDFSIQNASVKIHLPNGAVIQQNAVYTGPQGSTGKDARVTAAQGNEFAATITRVLPPREGFTVAVGWQKGIVTPPSQSQQQIWFLKDNAGYGGLLATLLTVAGYFFYAWNKVGRDPPQGTIIPLFYPPENLGPAGVRYVWKQKFDNPAMAAALVGLAVKGHLKIKNADGDYTVEKIDNPKPVPLTDPEAAIYNLLPAGAFDIDQANQPKVASMVSMLEKKLRTAYSGILFKRNMGWFTIGLLISIAGLGLSILLMPDGMGFVGTFIGGFLAVVLAAVLSMGWAAMKGLISGNGWFTVVKSIAILLFLLPVFGAGIGVPTAILSFGNLSTAAIVTACATVVLGLMNILFHYLMPAPTDQGAKVLNAIEGFRMYMTTAEEKRLDMLNPPEKTPELFERYLPYAMALDCENAWNKKFEAVLAAAAAAGAAGTAWYVSSGHNTGWGGMSKGFGNSLASSISSASTVPGSSSGSSGGGSSGGGGGGGGGGGW